MSFWLITGGLTLLVALILLRALQGRPGAAAPDAGEFDLSVYRDQLAEVERDAARGVMSAADAERARTEISRRILAADKRAQESGSRRTAPRGTALAAGLIALVLFSGLGLYLWLGAPGYGDLGRATRLAQAETIYETRPSQAEAEARMEARGRLEPTVSAEFETLMTRLRAAVQSNPGDLQGQRLLARNETALGNFAAASAAQRRVLEILGPGAMAQDHAELGEILTIAAGGYVSPEAEAAFRAALERAPEDGRASYYIGLMLLQTGRPDIAFRLWQPLFEKSPPDAPWMPALRAQILDAAQLAGVDYAPDLSNPLSPGPTAEDVEAASQMSAEDRQAMIEGMVSRLSDRLAQQGGTAEDWARLIRALGVLGRDDQAQVILDEARLVFGNDAQALGSIEAAAADAGLRP